VPPPAREGAGGTRDERGESERMGSNGVGWGARHGGALRHEQARVAGGSEAAWE
jgi:hypothetical protein